MSVDTTASVIIHQVNCFTIGAGVAKAIVDRWPLVKEEHERVTKNSHNFLGKIQPVYVNDKQCVINMFSQYNYGNDSVRYTSYDALYDCLVKVRNFVIEHYGYTTTIALPYNMSCGRGGASWNVVMAMITDIFETSDLNIEIWKL